jgi:hypothetical protein
MKFPKPPKRLLRRLALKRATAAARKRCRVVVLARDGYRCRYCNAYVGARGHVHEIVFRSRGGSPVEPTNCVTLCAEHHEAVQRHRIIITAEDAIAGANGTLVFTNAQEASCRVKSATESA